MMGLPDENRPTADRAFNNGSVPGGWCEALEGDLGVAPQTNIFNLPVGALFLWPAH